MEQFLIALAALLGSSLTAAYVTNSWQKRKYTAEALDDCLSSIFENIALIRINLGKAWNILQIHTELGKVQDVHQIKMEECSEAALESLAVLDAEKLRLITLEPTHKDDLDRLMAAVLKTMKPVSIVYFSPCEQDNQNRGFTINMPNNTIDNAVTELDTAQRELTREMKVFAMQIGIARRNMIETSWKMKPKWIIAAGAAALVIGLVYYQYGASQIVISGENVFRYHRISGKLEQLHPIQSISVTGQICSKPEDAAPGRETERITEEQSTN